MAFATAVKGTFENRETNNQQLVRRPSIKGSARGRADHAQTAGGLCPCGGGCGPCGLPASIRKVAPLAKTRPEELEQEADTLAERGRLPSVHSAASGRRPALRSNPRGIKLGGGRSIPHAQRLGYEEWLGHDLSQVRIHTDANAATMASGLSALAFTHGLDVVFGENQFKPQTVDGERILRHELVHVVQQGATGQTTHPWSVHGRTGLKIQRASPADCAGDCAAPDGTATATGAFSVTVYADKEGPFLLIPLTSGVGHSWLRLEDDGGRYWTYGFWPESGFDANNPTKDVPGCVHHPDTSHEPTASMKFDLSPEEFALAHAKAKEICLSKPKYNLFGLQCTEFVLRVLRAAGKAPSLGFGLIWESPNALDSWLRSHSLTLGVSYSPWASSGSGGAALDLAYRHQLLSTLGNRLRLYASARGEVGGTLQTVTLGTGVALDPGRVWLPKPYVEAGATAGGFPSGAGAGVTLATGLRYNIDELAVVGVEYNLVKDLVREDPAIGRLVLQLGLRLW